MENFAVIGDIHGCLVEFKELVGLIRERFHVTIVSLGDFLDKGPFGPECVTFARENGIECVMGNHEEWCLRWVAHEWKARHSVKGYVNPMVPKLPQDIVHLERLSAADENYLRAAPFYRVFGDYVLVHGGLQPSIPLEKQDPKKMIRLRWISPEGDHVPTNYSAEPHGPPKPGAVYWMEKWDGPHHVVYGHEAHDLEKPVIHTSPAGYDCIGIDTGVVHGGCLTALVVVDGVRTFLSVPAKEVYLDPKKHWDNLKNKSSCGSPSP